ncbi:MAG TPA: 2-phospho-L-lactate transferase CofD family protein [Anaerolineales bacterium]|nr:2-phospho-L-lactate transferase CofD family protein [Anaerolineales bacterium]
MCAELQDRTILRGETNIDQRGSSIPKIMRVFLMPRAKANPHAVQAILNADAIVLGPGDLYTSVIPNLLVRDIPGALQRTSATLIYVCNLMTKLGETDDFSASQFVSEINRYLGGKTIDWALVNTAPIEQEIQERYAIERARPVYADLDRLEEQGVKYVGSPFADNNTPVRHNSPTLSEAILRLVHSNRIVEAGTQLRQMSSLNQ